MRITHQSLTRNYLSRMGTNLQNLTGSNEKLSSGRKFVKGSENVSDAGKALKIRKLVVDNERYQTTIRDAQGRAAAAEDALRNVNSLMIQAEDRVIEGLNGTMSERDREIIATELEKMQDEVFQIMNAKFSDKYIFASAGNSDGSAPFSKGDNGELIYNGTTVDSMFKETGKKTPQYMKENDDGSREPADIPYNKDNYVDIGAGFAIGAGGAVDPNTAFKDTYSGVESFGYGTTEEGAPLNAYSLLGRMVDDLRNNNEKSLGEALNAISGTMDYMLTTITEVGARGTTLENAASRLENEYGNLLEIQNDLEGVDISEEVMHNKSFEMSWMVTLQLGSKILPSTIFDFIR